MEVVLLMKGKGIDGRNKRYKSGMMSIEMDVVNQGCGAMPFISNFFVCVFI